MQDLHFYRHLMCDVYLDRRDRPQGQLGLELINLRET